MIDSACFEGSSGSPVFIADEGSYSTEDGIAFGTRFFFLGILYAGPQQTIEGEIEVRNIGTSQQPVAVSHIPTNLGNVIKSTTLKSFKNVLREQIDQQESNGS